MKVISGRAKGRKLRFPRLLSGQRLRPLTGRAKGALFNILAVQNPGARFLDLFAGTGSVGIEALSRGAKLAIFVEDNRKAVLALRDNIEMTGFSDRSEVYCLDVIKALKVLDKAVARFDIVFIGAPYGSSLLGETLKTMSETSIVDKDGIVVAERSKRDKISDSYGSLVRYRDANYGDTILSFYKIGAVK